MFHLHKMSILDDTYCHFCEKLITKEDWNKHLYSSRHLHKEAHGYWPAYFINGKPSGNESIILEKAFWNMIFATRDVKEVYELLITYSMMTTNLKNYIPDCEEFRNEFRDMVKIHFEYDMYNKFSGGDDRFSDSVTLEGTVISWLSNIRRLGGPIPNNASDYSFDAMLELKHKAF